MIAAIVAPAIVYGGNKKPMNIAISQKELTKHLESEAFFSAPRRVLRKVFRFLKVDSHFCPSDLTARNVASDDRDIPPWLRERLAGYFRPHNEELFELLGTQYNWITPEDM